MRSALLVANVATAHILVVDDEVGIRELLREILEESGYRVSTAATAAEADTYWATERPDLVLLDMSLPDRDGLALIRAWATSGRLPLPVVMLSAYGTIDSAVEATRSGAQDFLEKPVTLHRLLETVARTLATPRASSRFSPSAVAAQPEDGIDDVEATRWPPEAFGLPYREAKLEFERAYFLHVLAAEGGNMTLVSDRTGIERTHLYRKFKSLGLRLAPKQGEPGQQQP